MRFAIVLVALVLTLTASARVLHSDDSFRRYFMIDLARDDGVHFSERGWYQVGDRGFLRLEAGPFRYVEQCRAWLPASDDQVRFRCERFEQRPQWDLVRGPEIDFN